MTDPATRHETTFGLRYRVAGHLAAPPSTVWAALTDADAFPTWNRTVSRIKGPIAAGQRLEIEVTAAPGRTFRPRVVELEAPRHMVWRDGFAPMFRGTRTFTLTPEDGGTKFEMEEVFGGAMLPLIKGSLPDFRSIFDDYLADLRQHVERP